MKQKEVNSESFLKRLFYWKYLIVVIILSILASYNINTSIIEKVSGKFGFITIVAIVFAVNSKNKRFLLFLSSLFLYSTIAFTIHLSITMIMQNTNLFENKNNMKIQKLLKLNYSKLPMAIDDETMLLKYTSDAENTIKLHIKFTKHTKEEILTDYQGSVSSFEADMLKGELESSCIESMKNILSDEFINWIAYYDKYDNLVGQIYLNDERCKPYYK